MHFHDGCSDLNMGSRNRENINTHKYLFMQLQGHLQAHKFGNWVTVTKSRNLGKIMHIEGFREFCESFPLAISVSSKDRLPCRRQDRS